jgi:predicted phage-related endonuclease
MALGRGGFCGIRFGGLPGATHRGFPYLLQGFGGYREPLNVVSVYILDNEEIRHYIIPRNDEFIKRAIETGADFWNNYIVPGVMPAAIGIENEDSMITGMFEGAPETIILGNAEKDLCAEYVHINGRLKDLENRKKQIQIAMKEAIVRHGGGRPAEKKASAAAGHYSVSWSFHSRKSVDTDALKKAGLYETYAKTSETGRFTISEKKGA